MEIQAFDFNKEYRKISDYIHENEDDIIESHRDQLLELLKQLFCCHFEYNYKFMLYIPKEAFGLKGDITKEKLLSILTNYHVIFDKLNGHTIFHIYDLHYDNICIVLSSKEDAISLKMSI